MIIVINNILFKSLLKYYSHCKILEIFNIFFSGICGTVDCEENQVILVRFLDFLRRKASLFDVNELGIGPNSSNS